MANESIYIQKHPFGYVKRIASVMEGNVPAFIKRIGDTAVCVNSEAQDPVARRVAHVHTAAFVPKLLDMLCHD